MLDVEQIVLETVKKMETDGKLKELIEGQIEKAMKSAIDDCFNYEFGRELTAKVKEQLAIDLDKISLPEYNTLLLNQVEIIAKAEVMDIGIAKVKEQMKEILTRKRPEVLKLSALIEIAKSDETFPEEYSEVEVEISGDYSTKWVTIVFVPRTSSRYSSNKRVAHFGVNEDMTLCAITVEEFQKDLTKVIFAGGLYGMGAELFAAYTNGTKMLLDEAECDLYFNDEDEY